MKQKISIILQGFFTALALTTQFHMPLVAANYETRMDYVIASVYELLGEYNLTFLLIWILGSVFYFYLKDKVIPKRNTSGILAVFFALCLVFGKSYFETNSSIYVLGSAVNFLKAAGVFVGYFCMIYVLLAWAFVFFEKTEFTEEKKHFFSKHAFLKSFLILTIVYGFFVLLSYPGTLCWDVIGQIEQVTKNTGYSTHHPLLHTLLVGGLVQFGKNELGSYEIGLFLYMIVQMLMLVTALSATISVLAKRKMKFIYLLILLLLYVVTPFYTNIVSVAIKDVPYSAFFVGYMILYVRLLEKPSYIKNLGFLTNFILLQMGVILSRNNGLYVVVLCGIGAFIYLYKSYDWKEKVAYICSAFLVSVAVSKLIVFVLMQLTGAVKGSSAEMFSIPFQQTARYLQLYQDEISEEERTAIENVLGDVSTVAASYNPLISDHVKMLYNKEATTEQVVAYFKVWAKMFFQHPGTYVEAFFVHIYGWFSPNATSAIRYETTYEDISQQGLFENAQKCLIFLYRFADRISILGVLENVGAYVWGLFFFAFYNRKQKKKPYIYGTLPLFVSLLICMASPCFIYHPRYALPILLSLPMMYGFMLTCKEECE